MIRIMRDTVEGDARQGNDGTEDERPETRPARLRADFHERGVPGGASAAGVPLRYRQGRHPARRPQRDFEPGIRGLGRLPPERAADRGRFRCGDGPAISAKPESVRRITTIRRSDGREGGEIPTTSPCPGRWRKLLAMDELRQPPCRRRTGSRSIDRRPCAGARPAPDHPTRHSRNQMPVANLGARASRPPWSFLRSRRRHSRASGIHRPIRGVMNPETRVGNSLNRMNRRMPGYAVQTTTATDR